jgi:pimeloyl-ACP methyl ester carboxylesterase
LTNRGWPVNVEAGGAPLQTTTIKIAGIDLEVFEAGQATGQGIPLVWLHSGQGFSPKEELVPLLSAKCRLIAPSHPGFGRSSLPDWLDSIDDIAHIYLELFARLGIDRFNLAGCSVGGWIAAEIASKIPERIGRLVMIGPVGVKLGPADKLDVPDIFAMPQDEVDKLLRHDPERSKVDFKSMSEEEVSVLVRNRETLALLTWEPWMHNPKLKHRLHRAAMPALFMRGASDGFVSADYLQGYAKLLPDARVVTIPAAGHAPHLEQPQATAKAVLDFLEASR